jgi:penicillin amidase
MRRGWLVFLPLLLTPTAKALTCRYQMDTDGVAHLHFESREGFSSCLGYVHGREQGFFVDYQRRAAQGRLAEVFGSSALEDDRRIRPFRLSEWAERSIQAMDAQEREMLKWYSKGVARGLKDSKASEFRDFGYEPEEWTERNTVEVGLYQFMVPLFYVLNEKSRQNDVLNFWKEKTDSIRFEEGAAWSTPSVPRRFSPASTEKESAALFPRFDLGEAASLSGSNAFAIAPARARNRRPILEADPHLPLKYPLSRFWVELMGSDGTVTFAGSIPGTYAFPIGATREIAWGVTNAFPESVPVALISVDDPDLKKMWDLFWLKTWIFKIPWLERRIELEDGWVALPGPSSKWILAVRWPPAGEAFPGSRGMWEVPFQKDAVSVLSTVQKFEHSVGNYVVIDSRGNIGYAINGRRFLKANYGVPTRDVKDLKKEVPEWLSAADLPTRSLNPKDGFVVNANSLPFADAEKWLGSSFMPSFRTRRLQELIEEKKNLSVEDVLKIPCDDLAVDARELVPLLLPVVEEVLKAKKDSDAVEAAALLRGWDFRTGLECKACAIYRTWMNALTSWKAVNETILYQAFKKSLAAPLREQITASFFQTVRNLKKASPKGFPAWKEVHVGKVYHQAGPMYRPGPSRALPGDVFAPFMTSATALSKPLAAQLTPAARFVVEMGEKGPSVFLNLPLPNDDRDLSKDSKKYPSDEWLECRYRRIELGQALSGPGVQSVEF